MLILEDTLVNFKLRPSAGDPFHVTQLRVIMDQADVLLKDFAMCLASQELPRNTYEYGVHFHMFPPCLTLLQICPFDPFLCPPVPLFQVY